VINLSPNDSNWVCLELYNRFSLWVLLRWILLLYDFWSGTAGGVGDLPFWASDSYTFFGKASTSNGHSCSGRMVLSLDRPFTLRVSGELISLKNMCSVTMSVDSIEPAAYILNVDVLSFSSSGVFSQEDKDLIRHTQEEAEEVHKGGLLRSVRKNIRGTLKGVAYGASGVVSGAASVVSGGVDVAGGMALGAAGATIGAARTIAAGNPVDFIKGAQTNLLAVGKDFVSVINEANTLFDEANDETEFLAAKFDKISQKLSVHRRATSNSHMDTFYMDLSEDAFSHRSLGSFARGSVQAAGSCKDVASVYPNFERGSTSLSLMSCQGNDNAHMLSGFRRLNMEQFPDKLDTVMEVPLDNNLGKRLLCCFAAVLLCCCAAVLLCCCDGVCCDGVCCAAVTVAAVLVCC
jgi:hypothetical protein